jgi:hypothetical protein
VFHDARIGIEFGKGNQVVLAPGTQKKALGLQIVMGRTFVFIFGKRRCPSSLSNLGASFFSFFSRTDGDARPTIIASEITQRIWGL